MSTFYETFLAQYDPKLRELRGVYYTPEPVVSYIVRSVDILLREQFDCPEGLADTSTVLLSHTDEQGRGADRGDATRVAARPRLWHWHLLIHDHRPDSADLSAE